MIKFTKTHPKYGCFSNFTNRSVTFDNLTFLSTEAAWQAQKTLDPNIRKEFTQLSPSDAKRKGRHVALRSDWEQVKYQYMVDVLYAKFSQHDDFKKALLSTGTEEIIEDTTGWHDNIWGNCDCPKCAKIVGQNLLGKALMEVRDRIA